MSEWVYDNDLEEWEQMGDMRSVTPAKREGAEEKVVIIYEGAKNREPNTSPNTEEDPTQTQSDSQPQQSCYSRRSFIAVSLSLSLLCHLLLAGIITLGLSNLKLHQENTNFVQKHQQLNRERLELGNFCKDGCRSNNQSFYYISTETKTWEGSRQDCRNRGADLIIIDSKEKQEFVSSLNLYLWIGLSNANEEGKWKWVDGSIITNATGLGVSWNPTLRYKANHCIVTYTHWSPYWQNNDCHKYFKWICEKNTNV